MIRALYTAATGMNAQQMNLDNIANNLANSSTTGFQERRMLFTDLLYQNEVMPGAASTQQTTVASGLQVGLGVRPVARGPRVTGAGGISVDITSGDQHAAVKTLVILAR